MERSPKKNARDVSYDYDEGEASDLLNPLIGDLIDDDNPNSRMMRKATYASVFAASILILIKSFAWIMTGSVALLASLVDSFLDLATSLVTLFAVKQALMPADDEFSFGYGKAEAVAGLVQSAFITGSALFIVVEALERFLHPRDVVEGDFGVMIMFLSVGITFALVLYQRKVVKQTKSIAIEADSVHYTGDILINAVVILALLTGQHYSMPIIDVVAGLLIALYLLYNCLDITKTSFAMLLDKEFPQEDREKIRKIASDFDGVINVHGLKTRNSGIRSFVQMHLVFDGANSLKDVHGIGDQVVDEVVKEFPTAEVIVHHDPAKV
ncbi:MAG: cation diffusion facilitator family transporter [Alphaproteobacteria bacterium]|nr:cation diffusion facilitator family transporter [Alphaproteobacteria bacterium]